MTLQQLKDFFDNTELPQTMKIKAGIITDVRKFVDSHTEILEGNPKKKTFIPYYDRLVSLYNSTKHSNINPKK